MTDTPKKDLIEYEEEATPFADVMRKLLEAKPASKKHNPAEDEQERPPEDNLPE